MKLVSKQFDPVSWYCLFLKCKNSPQLTFSHTINPAVWRLSFDPTQNNRIDRHYTAFNCTPQQGLPEVIHHPLWTFECEKCRTDTEYYHYLFLVGGSHNGLRLRYDQVTIWLYSFFQTDLVHSRDSDNDMLTTGRFNLTTTTQYAQSSTNRNRYVICATEGGSVRGFIALC
jgi:hypothetical protein